tara:strand:- start:1008 stop:1436 length:429 start_codon:yes stop_codon:yes gene_type:complete
MFPGYGRSFLNPSTDASQWNKRKLYNNDFAFQNPIKASWRSLKSEINSNYYLKSGQIQQVFKINIKSVGNLVKMIDDMNRDGKNTFHYLQEYSYHDTTYEMFYGHDLILDSPDAKMQQKLDKKREARDKDQAIKFSDELNKN